MEVEQKGEGGGRELSCGTARCLSEQALRTLYELYQSNQMCDAVIRLDDGGVFQVHRNILAACSSYFRALFTTTLHSSFRSDVHVPGVTSEDMASVIKFAYVRSVEVDETNVLGLLVAADYLSVLGLLQACCRFLEKSLSVANCLGIMVFARDHFCGDLEEKARRFALRNYAQVATESDELPLLSAADLQALLTSDDLNVRKEEVAWESALRWLSSEPHLRRQYVLPLLKSVRLGLLETKYFLEKVKDHPLVAGNEACRPMVLETLRYLYELETRDCDVPPPSIARPRVPQHLLFTVGGWCGGNATNFVETYDSRADQWFKVIDVDPKGPRAYHGTAVIGHDIIIMGGFDGLEYFNSCRCFNVVTKKWREVAPMNTRRCYVSVAVLGGDIYAIGGYDGQHRQSSAERYDFHSNQWTIIAAMNAQRSDADATTIDGKIYITGGFNGQECMNTAEMYDPETNQWTLIRPMTSRRSGVSCVAYHDNVYVIGGFNGITRLCSGEKFSPAANEWTQLPDMFNPRSNFAIEVIDDLLFAIGGFNGVTTINQVECYDDQTNQWYEVTNMSLCRSALAACVVSDLPNVREYIHENRERMTEDRRQRARAAAATQQAQAAQGQQDLDNDEDARNGNPAVEDVLLFAVDAWPNAILLRQPVATDDDDDDDEEDMPPRQIQRQVTPDSDADRTDDEDEGFNERSDRAYPDSDGGADDL